MKDPRGKTVLITGGAAGMGAIWAERFAADGARLRLWDIDDEALRFRVKALRAKGADVEGRVVDVADRKAVYAAAKAERAEGGLVDILVNNAAVVRAGPLLEVPDESIEATIGVDLLGLFWTMKAFLPAMIANNAGHVINISSAAGLVGVPGLSAYVAAKWGVIGLTETVRLELRAQGQTGVGFTVVCPSFVDTGMFEGVRPPLLLATMQPETLVDRAYADYRKGRYLVREPFMIKLIPVLNALLPRAVLDRIADITGANASMTDWRGHGKSSTP